jgi:predicted oxidoreductase (fatty acid repression mutant protein)|tara:strand:- start:490 stop:690 length:201 start_codon:yes stop_codon:yes gene_type:complete
MEIGEKAMATGKNKKPKWDGKSRVSNDLYRQRFDEIFKKMNKEKAIDETVPYNEDEEYLEELKDKL